MAVIAVLSFERIAAIIAGAFNSIAIFPQFPASEATGWKFGKSDGPSKQPSGLNLCSTLGGVWAEAK